MRDVLYIAARALFVIYYFIVRQKLCYLNTNNIINKKLH